MEHKTENIELWESVSETNPKYTKTFSRAGGFSGTSVNATYCIKKATEVFGAIGKAWGYVIDKEQMLIGHSLGNETFTKVHCVQVSLWYMLDGKRYDVPPQFGQTTFVGSNKNGIFTDEEAPKKSITDAVTKGLSLLGFNADIFLGQYDDNKYVNDMNDKYGVDATQDAPQTHNPAKTSDPTNPNDKALVDSIRQYAADNKFLTSVIDKFDQYGKLSDKQRAALVKTFKEKNNLAPKDDMPGSLPDEAYNDTEDKPF